MDIQVAGQDISPEEVTALSGWLTARSPRSKRGTDNSTPTNESSQAPSNRPRSRARQSEAQVLKAGRMQPLPMEDIKIVMRPKVALHIAKIGSPMRTKLTGEESLEDTVCLNTQRNIVIVSTPHSDHADRYARISSIQVNGVTHEVNAYETAAEHTTKGVIRGIPLTETPQQIHNKVVTARKPTALAAKRIASTTTVIIAFDGPGLPYQNKATLPQTVKGEPFPLQNSISIQATTLKIPVCIGITHHIYQKEQGDAQLESIQGHYEDLRSGSEVSVSTSRPIGTMVSKASLSRPTTRQKRHHSGPTAMASKRTQETGDTSSAEKEAEKPVQIDKWDGSAVRNALDDAVKKVLTEKYGYVENHRLTDGRLAICSIAVGAAMFALLWDFLYPFPESRTVLIACVLSYFFLMGVLTLYTTFLEKGIFLVALQKDKTGFDPDSVWTLDLRLRLSELDMSTHAKCHCQAGN
ncbi:hypothetical protein HPB49_023650 [Dermacentor silvarum]|uniref:Uncharacterized protein n=1 Tax=Dermacentor silvarum TaxID=543639 RepID=A0ACB8E3J4_DERSI|nr:hypothetical protein HPB49_023650 [Dermacentor silvarum]